MNTTRNNLWPQELIDRELTITRVIDAPRKMVFDVWTNPKHLPNWFGPEGFEIKTKEINLTVGGQWRFDMIAPDGTSYSNRMEFIRIDQPYLIQVIHGSDVNDDPNAFSMLVTFLEQSNGKTVVTMRQIHPSKTKRDEVAAFGAVEYGYQTLDKMANFLKIKE